LPSHRCLAGLLILITPAAHGPGARHGDHPLGQHAQQPRDQNPVQLR
jgi:hypothetical protein